MPRPERLWSVQDLADYLGVPIMTIYNWRSTGYGPKGVRVGRYVRYESEEVRTWFASLTEKVG